MSKFEKNNGYFKYKPQRDKRLKSRTREDRWQDGEWEQHWHTRDLRILKQVVSVDDDRSSDGDRDVLYTVKFPKYIKTIGQAKDFLSGVFHKGCSCSHDCCGHFFSSVWTHTFRRTKRKEYTISVSYQRNC